MAFPLFKALDMEDLEAIERLLEAQTIPPGCVLFEQGETVSGMFFIVSGEVLASVNDKPIGTIGWGEVLCAECFHRAFKVPTAPSLPLPAPARHLAHVPLLSPENSRRENPPPPPPSISGA